MGVLGRLLGVVPKHERNGICLGSDARWEVTAPTELPSFLRALAQFVPDDAILYLEGGSPRDAVKAFLETHCVPEVTHLAMGTIWPRPQVFHLPATPGNLSDLARLAEQCCAAEIAVHLHVYRDGRVLLEWHDAFSGDPLYISGSVSEDNVAAFCKALALEYRSCRQTGI
jgi:hypothetical protein